MNDLEEQYRKVFEDQVKEKILGPGFAKDILVCDEDASNEILDEDPTKLYCTGVMVPLNTSTGDIEDNMENEVVDNTDDNLDDDNVNASDDNQDDDTIRGRENTQNPAQDDQAYFDSDHIGIITCVSPETTSIQLDVTYAKYNRISINEAKIRAGHNYEELKEIIIHNDSVEQLVEALQNNGKTESFSSYFSFNDEEKTVSLKDSLGPNLSSRLEYNNLKNSDVRELINKLLKGTFYKRSPKSISLLLTLDQGQDIIRQPFDNHPDLNYSLKSYIFKGKKYLKVIIQNNRQRNDDAFYNQCVFQSVLKLTPIDGRLISYTEPIDTVIDEENNISEFIYRDVQNYGKGIACAVNWDDNGAWIETTYMPRCEVKKFSNKIENQKINNICTLRNISIWSTLGDDEILAGLNQFVEDYAEWHEKERSQVRDTEDNYRTTAERILERQELLLTRLRDNVVFMREHNEALTCFKIANTAMLIQMVISRDKNFVKNRDIVEENSDIFDSLSYFENSDYLSNPNNGIDREPAYYPFQLAFLLMNVKSTIIEDDPYRTKYVDLIWFPTGGGKTEAYLALTALTIISRRRNSSDIISSFNGQRPENYNSGVSVIMRYTLRLLTSQQFERASYLICALDFLRAKKNDVNLGNERISIGLWIGKSSTPNSVQEIRDTNGKYRQFLNNERQNNPFPVAYCPWCGKKMKPKGSDNHGYTGEGYLECQNDSCHFNTDIKLPIYYIDQIIYREKPTLLFATVDKFAQLYKDDAARLIRSENIKSPDLIIQDELHLISGPLGSTVSLFEGIVEKMASNGGHKPKIVASTATTRNTGALIRSLYGRSREVSIFPAQGTSYENNYFSHLENKALRCHIGIMPTGWTTSNDTEIRLTATLLLTRTKLALQLIRENDIDPSNDTEVINFLRQDGNVLRDELDNFWSIVLYFNSLKDLGRSKSKVSQEIYENLRAKKPYFQIPLSLDVLHKSFHLRTKEFTSREDSSRIKELLTKAESKVSLCENEGSVYVDNNRTLDLIYASNMISVGIDISRWNLMIMVGQPRSTSEYIQSSSRVARSHKGIVYNLINPRRNREYSVFENYTSFHAAYYKYVEPLSATPLNNQMIKLPLWANMIMCYSDYILNNQDEDRVIDGVINLLRDRYEFDDIIEEDIRMRIQDILADPNANDPMNEPMQSLRDVDPDSFIMINDIEYNNRNRRQRR